MKKRACNASCSRMKLQGTLRKRWVCQLETSFCSSSASNWLKRWWSCQKWVRAVAGCCWIGSTNLVKGAAWRTPKSVVHPSWFFQRECIPCVEATAWCKTNCLFKLKRTPTTKRKIPHHHRAIPCNVEEEPGVHIFGLKLGLRAWGCGGWTSRCSRAQRWTFLSCGLLQSELPAKHITSFCKFFHLRLCGVHIFWFKAGTQSSRVLEDGQADATSSWKAPRWSFPACELLPSEASSEEHCFVVQISSFAQPKMQSFGTKLGHRAPGMWRMDKQMQPAVGGQ